MLTKATLALVMVASGGEFSVSVTVRLGAIGVAAWPWKKVSVPPVAGVRTGGKWDGATATANDCWVKLTLPLTFDPWSVTVTVIVAVSLTPATGVKVSVPVVPGLE